MGRLFYVHWNRDEAASHARLLRSAGHRVRTEVRDGGAAVRAIQASPPDAVVIDLRRVPSHGEAVGVALRTRKATRSLPLVFVEGDPAKAARVKRTMPDAVFTSWRGIRGAVKRAMRSPPEAPVVPSSPLAPYGASPLWRKLGIRPALVVALIGAPDHFESTLGEMPHGVVLRTGARGRADLTLYFARRRRDLAGRIDRLTARAEKGGLWLLWPKRASGRGSDLTQAIVRQIGMDAGLVDFKICSVDATWSGLRFTRRETG